MFENGFWETVVDIFWLTHGSRIVTERTDYLGCPQVHPSQLRLTLNAVSDMLRLWMIDWQQEREEGKGKTQTWFAAWCRWMGGPCAVSTSSADPVYWRPSACWVLWLGMMVTCSCCREMWLDSAMVRRLTVAAGVICGGWAISAASSGRCCVHGDIAAVARVGR